MGSHRWRRNRLSHTGSKHGSEWDWWRPRYCCTFDLSRGLSANLEPVVTSTRSSYVAARSSQRISGTIATLITAVMSRPLSHQRASRLPRSRIASCGHIGHFREPRSRHMQLSKPHRGEDSHRLLHIALSRSRLLLHSLPVASDQCS